MADSDSDDELMSRLTSMVGGFAGGSGEDCAYCATPNASLGCSICSKAFYCSEVRGRNAIRRQRTAAIITN